MPTPPAAEQLCADVWLLQSGFKFFNLTSIGLNGLVVRVTTADQARLVLVNPPKMSPEVLHQIDRIEAQTNAHVEAIVQPGDWHHFQLPAACAAFPAAKCYVASQRNLRKQPPLVALGTHVLDRTDPKVPELGGDVALVPWLGYSQDGMPGLMSGEARGAARVEFVLVHRPSGTLFITDHFLPPKPGVRVGKPNTVGFRLADEAAARASVRAVLDHKVQRVVFSHGARAECVLEEAATGSILADAYEGLLEAHGVDGPRCEEVAP